MTLQEIAEKLELRPLTPEVANALARDIERGHVSDLLSDVLANAPAGGMLVTIQVHLNVIAVAMHAELAAVVFAAGRTPGEAVRQKAADEGIALFATDRPAFDVVGGLHALGIRGSSP